MTKQEFSATYQIKDLDFDFSNPLDFLKKYGLSTKKTFEDLSASLKPTVIPSVLPECDFKDVYVNDEKFDIGIHKLLKAKIDALPYPYASMSAYDTFHAPSQETLNKKFLVAKLHNHRLFDVYMKNLPDYILPTKNYKILNVDQFDFKKHTNHRKATMTSFDDAYSELCDQEFKNFLVNKSPAIVKLFELKHVSSDLNLSPMSADCLKRIEPYYNILNSKLQTESVYYLKFLSECYKELIFDSMSFEKQLSMLETNRGFSKYLIHIDKTTRVHDPHSVVKYYFSFYQNSPFSPSLHDVYNISHY
jgi:hypothetical protein